MLDKVAKALVADNRLVREVRRREGAENAVESVWVDLLDKTKRLDDGRAEILVALAQIVPVASFRDYEKVLLWEPRKFDIAVRLRKRGGVLPR